MPANTARSIPPVGICIYCGTKEGRLTREHVLPRMLGGDLVLPRASCDPCAKITASIEGYAGRRIFQDVRLKHGFRITDRPAELTVLEEFGPDPKAAKQTLVPTKNAPGALVLPSLEPAGIISGRAPGEKFDAEMHTWLISDGVNDTPEVRQDLQIPGKFYRELDLTRFGRFIAKMALGFGVAACGIDGFEPSISGIILNESTEWAQWIGGTTEAMDEFPAPQTLSPTHGIVAFARMISEYSYLHVQIQLLTYLNTPIYTAVVGKLNNTGLIRLDV